MDGMTGRDWLINVTFTTTSLSFSVPLSTKEKEG